MRQMLDFLPSTATACKKSILFHGEVLETVIIEDIFMPEVIELLSGERNISLLKSMFNYFEEVSNCEDVELKNVFSITVLEILGNDETILETARKYMGTKTTQLQKEADRALGRS